MMMVDDFLNSSSDSYILDTEVNPKTLGKSRKIVPPNTNMLSAFMITKQKLKNATRRANIYCRELENYEQTQRKMQNEYDQLAVQYQ